jgi:hypothetical protein
LSADQALRRRRIVHVRLRCPRGRRRRARRGHARGGGAAYAGPRRPGWGAGRAAGIAAPTGCMPPSNPARILRPCRSSRATAGVPAGGGTPRSAPTLTVLAIPGFTETSLPSSLAADAAPRCCQLRADPPQIPRDQAGQSVTCRSRQSSRDPRAQDEHPGCATPDRGGDPHPASKAGRGPR